MGTEPIREEEAPVAPVTPATQLAMRAKEHLLTAAVAAQPSRRPPAETREVAVPVVNAIQYLLDAVLDLQGQIARLQAEALDADAGRLRS